MRIRVPPAMLLLFLLLGLTWAAYTAGLHGDFLFDDYSNLPALGATGPVDTWATFWRFVTSGTADPTGRPLTLLTFLLDAHNWPADPYPFKRTNLILHLGNGLLLALLLRRLGRDGLTRAITKRIDLAAVVGAGIWLLHPLFVSTTLYIVQREAMLPTTFVLIGLLAWLHGRRVMHAGQVLRGTLWIALGLGGCTLLGVLSKANGILLPALSLIVEYALLQPSSSIRMPAASLSASGQLAYRRSMLLFGWMPAAFVTAYLVQQGWNGLTEGISSVRPWTLGQRLLTEPRVLLDYLNLLWLPRPFTPGVFNDHIHASASLWSPASTLPALVVAFALIMGAWLTRRRWPPVALAILFYFVGQSLESSTVALELYFEHRNYLPAMLMFWPLALWLCGVSLHPASRVIAVDQSSQKPVSSNARNIARFALTALILLGLSLMTHSRASLWGDSHDQALLWAQLNPDSPRAQANAAQAELNSGRPSHAAARLRAPLTRAPDQVQLALNLFAAECQMGLVDPATILASRRALRSTRDPGSLLVSWFERATDQVAQPPCPQLNFVTLSSLLQAALKNPFLADNPGRQQDLHYLQGLLALRQGDPDTALTEFNRALDLQVRSSVALKQAAVLGASGFPQQGLSHLDHLASEPAEAYEPGVGMPRIHAWVLQYQHYWPKELARLRATLREDAARRARHAE